jgi:hypothetical protein
MWGYLLTIINSDIECAFSCFAKHCMKMHGESNMKSAFCWTEYCDLINLVFVMEVQRVY